MEGKALILILVFTVVNCHVYFGKDRPDSIFDTIPHVLHDMIKGHHNVNGNTYNQQPELNNYNPDNRYGNRMNPAYQQNNMGYQNIAPNGYSMPTNQGPLNSEMNGPSNGYTAGYPTNYNTEEVHIPPVTTTKPAEVLHLSTNHPLVLNSSTPDFNTDKASPSNIKNDLKDMTNNNPESGTNQPKEINKNQNTVHVVEDENISNGPTLNKEKESVRVNKQRNPHAIVFPDNIEEVKREAKENHNNKASDLPNRFNDTPQVLYAVNIAPSGTNQWNSSPSAPLTNSLSQASSTNSQTPNQASFATLITPNQIPLTNKMAQSNPFGDSIILPNANGGSSLYTIVNLPNTIANADVPSQMFQSNIISNPTNYQVQTSIPTANGGIINGMPTYYVVSVPNQPIQTVQTSVPFTNAPIRYNVGYISATGQTVLVPIPPVVYQIFPQTFVPISQNNLQSTYVPVTSVQPNVIPQPLSNQGNVASVTYVPVSNPVNTGQQAYMTVPNTQTNVPNGQINYVPVANEQGNTLSQPNYVTISSPQGDTGPQVNVVPAVQENAPNAQINYLPVSNGQENLGSQPSYLTVTNQGNTGSQVNLVPVSNTPDTQNYVPVSSGQSNVVTLTSAPSNMALPADTQSVTLLSFKDKDEEKPKKKPSKKKSKKK